MSKKSKAAAKIQTKIVKVDDALVKYQGRLDKCSKKERFLRAKKDILLLKLFLEEINLGGFEWQLIGFKGLVFSRGGNEDQTTIATTSSVKSLDEVEPGVKIVTDDVTISIGTDRRIYVTAKEANNLLAFIEARKMRVSSVVARRQIDALDKWLAKANHAQSPGLAVGQ